MTRIRLRRRREVWVPTLWGWLLLAGCGAALILGGVRWVHPFLAPQAPVPGAAILVVEGWLSNDELDQAVGICHHGAYHQVITTGAPAEARLGVAPATTYAELAADYLRAAGVAHSRVVPVPSPATEQDRTFVSAAMVGRWLAAHHPDCRALDVVSSGVHGRRTRRLYRQALGGQIQVGILSAAPTYDAAHWWRSSEGAKTVLTEALGFLWSVLFFDPPPVGGREGLWALQSRHAR